MHNHTVLPIPLRFPQPVHSSADHPPMDKLTTMTSQARMAKQPMSIIPYAHPPNHVSVYLYVAKKVICFSQKSTKEAPTASAPAPAPAAAPGQAPPAFGPPA